MTADGSYEFTHEGRVLGRLVWVEAISRSYPSPGWWLTSLGWPAEQIYRVPPELQDDLPLARARGVAMTLGLAEQVLADRAEARRTD